MPPSLPTVRALPDPVADHSRGMARRELQRIVSSYDTMTQFGTAKGASNVLIDTNRCRAEQATLRAVPTHQDVVLGYSTRVYNTRVQH